MPAVTSAAEEEIKAEKANQQRAALKKHIIRERQRRKEEQEAEVEEERLRKEREARERQDVMTLGETREQIQQLEQKLAQSKEEKHQLFLQLKKVLNEDDNRKRQQNNKDSNEIIHNMVSGGNMVQSQLFLPPTVSQGNPNMGRPPLSVHMLNKGGGANIKRVRSPSPPYANPGTTYLHHAHHNKQHPPHAQGPIHKMEDGRSREISRAVLWNKPSQYSSSSSASFYALPSSQPAYTAPIYQHGQHHVKQQNEYVRQAPPQATAAPAQPRHSQLVSGQVHPSMQHTTPQIAKTGGITSGYPVRQQNPPVQQSPAPYPSRHRY